MVCSTEGFFIRFEDKGALEIIKHALLKVDVKPKVLDDRQCVFIPVSVAETVLDIIAAEQFEV